MLALAGWQFKCIWILKCKQTPRKAKAGWEQQQCPALDAGSVCKWHQGAGPALPSPCVGQVPTALGRTEPASLGTKSQPRDLSPVTLAKAGRPLARPRPFPPLGSSFQPQPHGCRVIFNPLSALADSSFGRRCLLCPSARLSWAASPWEGLLQGGMTSEALWGQGPSGRAPGLSQATPVTTLAPVGRAAPRESTGRFLPELSSHRAQGELMLHHGPRAMGALAQQGRVPVPLSPMGAACAPAPSPAPGPRHWGNRGSFSWG